MPRYSYNYTHHFIVTSMKLYAYIVSIHRCYGYIGFVSLQEYCVSTPEGRNPAPESTGMPRGVPGGLLIDVLSC